MNNLLDIERMNRDDMIHEIRCWRAGAYKLCKDVKVLRNTKRALWLARANAANLMATKEAFVEYKREHPRSRWNDVRGCYSCFCSFTNWSRLFINAERRCRQYADKFKEVE